MSEPGLHPDIDAPSTTRVRPIEAALLAQPCAHDLPLWQIDGELWHERAIERDHPVLVTCDAPGKPARAKRARS